LWLCLHQDKSDPPPKNEASFEKAENQESLGKKFRYQFFNKIDIENKYLVVV